MESGSTFDLNSKTLVQLADAGISPNTIDLMLALAYPERFEISRETEGRSYGGGGVDLGYSYNYWDTFYFAPFGYYYWYTPYQTFLRAETGRDLQRRHLRRATRQRARIHTGWSTTGGAVSAGSAHRRGSSSTSKGSSSGSGSASSKAIPKAGLRLPERPSLANLNRMSLR